MLPSPAVESAHHMSACVTSRNDRVCLLSEENSSAEKGFDGYGATDGKGGNELPTELLPHLPTIRILARGLCSNSPLTSMQGACKIF